MSGRISVELHKRADRAVGSRGVHDPVCLDDIATFVGGDLQRYLVFGLSDPGDLVLPAQIDAAKLSDSLDQIPFEIELLQIDEGRLPRQILLAAIELIDHIIACERPPNR